MRIVIAIVFLGLLATRSVAFVPDRTQVFGAGNIACSLWLSTSETEAQGVPWILGYVSGANDEAEVHSLGRVEFDRIVAVVRRECRAFPREKLFDATAKAYDTLRKAR